VKHRHAPLPGGTWKIQTIAAERFAADDSEQRVASKARMGGHETPA